MVSSKNYNFTKKELSKDIFLKVGISNVYINLITDDLIDILKILIKKDKLIIKNFDTYKTILKKERMGRNPKTRESYKIKKRKALSLIVSKHLNKQINIY